MLVGTLGGSLIGNILAGKGEIAKRQSQWINRAGKELSDPVMETKKVEEL